MHPEFKIEPAHKLAATALMWQREGHTLEASHLSAFLSKCKKFPTLWCEEREFDKLAHERFFDLVSKIPPVTKSIPEYDIETYHTAKFAALFTWSGNGTSMGALKAEGFEVRALGPDTMKEGGFGIAGSGENKWARAAFEPEVWVELKEHIVENGVQMKVRMMGLSQPTYFSFYVKAASLKVTDQIFLPKTLKRFEGLSNKVLFDKWCIESSLSRKIQITPLSGENGYWDSDFIVSFEIHPLESQVNFSILLLNSL